MNKIKCTFLVALFAFQLTGRAQNVIVESFSSTSSVEARTHKRLDPNGIPCALIKVRSLINGLKFKEAMDTVENKTNEYWVFVPDQSEVLTIFSESMPPYVLRYADYGEEKVTTNVTYILSLIKSSTPEKKEFTSKSTPSDFQKRAEAGNAEDQCNLGRCYLQGQGVPQNYYTALSWFRKAAEKDWAEAQFYIGRCYLFGQGFPKPDYNQAVIWFEKAAKQNYADAQYQLGVCYEKGQGIKQNLKTARKWYEKAAKNGSAKARLIIE